ncbi:MAG: sialate O-acetylesterase [Oscillospiraceae bacterium]|nr:sialate O-acetylesterase [Oscillospiraceae bacterium]
MLQAAPVFTDHMVLQREKPIRVFGKGQNGTAVTCTLGPCSARCEVRGGTWQLTLPPMPAGGPLTMTISAGEETLTFSDVYLGEVWLCGGQSNMELPVYGSADPEDALRDCEHSGVRLYHVGKRGFFDEQFYAEEAASRWQPPCRDTVPHWTAVGYYFARMLARHLGVTVGLVECNYGGTSASAWMSEEALSATAAGRAYLEEYETGMQGLTDEEANRAYLEYCEYHNAWQARIDACYKEHPDIPWEEALKLCGENRYPGPPAPVNPLRPHGLYDTMLRRITPYTLRGVLYYQGESDDHRPETYRTLLEGLIRLWREDFRDPHLPFLLMQLPMFSYENLQNGENWPLIREAQELVYRTVRYTGLAVIPDCGEYNEIHPKEKREPARRLFLQALREVYHMQTAHTTAPLVACAVQEGSGIRVYFDNAQDGLSLRGTEGFAVCGADGIWHPAAAEIRENSLLLSAPEVPVPAGARYGWYNFGPVTLFGQDGLPAAPFRVML